MNNRWYELSPDVCIVISKIELAPDEDRIRYAKILLDELRKSGYIANRRIYLERIRNYEMRRWYDKNKTLFMAFEYLKDAKPEIQNLVANKILHYMRLETAA
ncbi:MAG: hypothetical protein E7Z87_08385 [Cyanobacteria bacterium SIG26]|nr:hypothetical protein [Cyanobacteria bacterium SIG26]